MLALSERVVKGLFLVMRTVKAECGSKGRKSYSNRNGRVNRQEMGKTRPAIPNFILGQTKVRDGLLLLECSVALKKQKNDAGSRHS